MGLAVLASASKSVLIHSTVKRCKQEMGIATFMYWLEVGVMAVLLPWSAVNGELVQLPAWVRSHSAFDNFSLLAVSLMGGFRAYTLTLVLAYSGSALYLVFCNSLVQSIAIITSILLFHITGLIVIVGVSFSTLQTGLYYGLIRCTV